MRNSGTHERDSSLELLRITAMFMIVAHHFSYGENFRFPADSLTLNRLWIQFLNMGGKLGVNIFVLISGYFLVMSDGVKLKRIIGLWLKTLFYSLLFFALFVIEGRVKFRAADLLYAFMPITKGSWWFAEVYFVLYLLHPYINILLRSLTKAEFQKMLLLLGVCWSVMPTFTNSYLASSALSWFVFLYSIAGYIRLWADDFGSKNYLWLSLSLIMINFLIVIVFDVIGFRIRMFAEHPLHWYNMQMLPILIIPVCMFIGFKHMDLKYSRKINLIASGAFGVYLIHCHRNMSRFLWDDVCRTLEFQDSPYLIPYSIAAVFAIYAAATLIDIARAKLFKILSRGRLS